jgi:hypothetical protein
MILTEENGSIGEKPDLLSLCSLQNKEIHVNHV